MYGRNVVRSCRKIRQNNQSRQGSNHMNAWRLFFQPSCKMAFAVMRPKRDRGLMIVLAGMAKQPGIKSMHQYNCVWSALSKI